MLQRLRHQPKQFLLIEGFGQVLKGAGFHHADRLLDGAESRDNNHGGFASPSADSGQNLVPRYLGHLHVGDDQVDKFAVVLDLLKRRATVRRRERFITRFLQQQFHQVTHIIAVFDDQRANISGVLRVH
jgi:hypothetical protein